MRPIKALTSCCAIALVVLAGCANDNDDAGAPADANNGTLATPAADQIPDANPAGRVEGTGAMGPGVNAPGTAAGSNPILVATAGGPAPYLANSAGSALYFVEGDTDGSKCVAPCTEAWPPFLVSDTTPTAGPELEPGMLGSITRADGAVQVTYNQHPLYRYAADTGAGRTAGNDVQDKWGHWHLVSPAGDAVQGGGQ